LRNQAELQCGHLDLGSIDSPAVVRDQDLNLVPIQLRDGDSDRAKARLVFLLAFCRLLDAMVDTVSNQMNERIFDFFEDSSIDFDFSSFDHKIHFLGLIA